MIVDPPTWTLRTPCPCCQQGGPELATCQGCGQVFSVCAELGTVFADPLARQRAAMDDACPRCGAARDHHVRPATAAELLAAGLTTADYE